MSVRTWEITGRPYRFDFREGERIIGELAELDDYDEEAVLEIIRGIGFDLFQVLDEKPGWFGYYYGADSKEWHWKLRRARNGAPGFFDAINA